MPFATLFGGTLTPVLLMLSPFAVMAAKDCTGWHPVAKVTGKPEKSPCAPPPLRLM